MANMDGVKGPKVGSPWVSIPDDGYTMDPISFCVPPHYRDAVESVLVPHGAVQVSEAPYQVVFLTSVSKDRIEKMAWDIFQRQQGRPLVTLCILKGGYRFYNDLMVKDRS